MKRKRNAKRSGLKVNRKKVKSIRDSFDRFGDDLCQEILQYLSFEDKISFECVSKQWKAYIYCRQYVLDIRNDKSDNTINGLPANKLLSYYRRVIKLKNVSVIECVLRKCKQINDIRIGSYIYWLNMYIKEDQLLAIIADNCINLTSIEINGRMSANALTYFGEKCGKTLKTIKTDSYRYMDSFEQLLEYCPNVLTVNKLSLDKLINDKIIVPKLREVIDITIDQRIDLMNSFTTRFANTLKVFDCKYVGHDCNAFIEQISKLTNLETLALKIMYDIDVELCAENFSIIGSNCSRITHLSVWLYQCNAKKKATKPLLTAINSFTKLNYLYLNILSTRKTEEHISVSLLKDCSQLKHLKLNSLIDSKFFSEVDIYLPQLSTIEIITSKCVTNVMINHLSKLKNLREVNINSKSNAKITDSGVCDLIENCPLFRSFTFTPFPHITQKTMKKFIKVAKNRPKINFTHIFIFNDIKDIQTFKSVVSNSSKSQVHNLKIQFSNLYRPIHRKKIGKIKRIAMRTGKVCCRIPMR